MLLPAPLGPTSATFSPRAIRRSMPCRASKPSGYEKCRCSSFHPAGGDVVGLGPFAGRVAGFESGRACVLRNVELVGRMLVHVEVRVRGRVLVSVLVG